MNIFSSLALRVAIYAIIALVCGAWSLYLIASHCYCDTCNDPFAVFVRGEQQFCRTCAHGYDRALGRIHRRRSLLRRIWRSAA
jgi:hypothetical protein